MTTRFPEPEVLVELREIASIGEKTYALPHLPLLEPTAANKFDKKILGALSLVHFMTAKLSAKRLAARKKIARCAQELAETLGKLKPDEKTLLVQFTHHNPTESSF